MPGPVAGSAEPIADYTALVKPVLARRCFACHGAGQQKAGLRLDTARAIRQGGDSGPALEPGDAAASLILDRIKETDETQKMPPEGEPLSPAEIAAIETWINAGSPEPHNEQPQTDPRQHWAFRPPVRKPVPGTANSHTPGNPIDAFLAAEQAQRGLTAAKPADRLTLIRRVTLDLTGLLPTTDEVQAFLGDNAPGAYARLVERLLASTAHGERWARHWMDVWRYSDWYGYGAEIRNSQPHLWRWRDWIVTSLNTDSGYNTMVQTMLAGDELSPGDPASLAATGFLGRNWYKFNRNVWLQDTVEHTSKAFLGLTFNCARCHDHKYDPLAQEDYYRLRAFFEPYDLRTDRTPGQPDLAKDGISHAYDAHKDRPTFVFARGDEKQPREDRPIAPGVPHLLGGTCEIQPVPLPPPAYYTGLQPHLRAEAVATAESRVAQAQTQLDQAIEAVVEARADLPARSAAEARRAVALASLTAARAELASVRARIDADDARFAATPDSKAREIAAYLASQKERQAVALRAEADLLELEAAIAGTRPLPAEPTLAADKLRERLAPALKKRDDTRAALAKASQTYSPLAPVYPETSTGRRLALARWITARENPTAARVAVNHVWMRHFCSPLVASVFDFGNSGKPPTHPALLDWLAVEFMEHGWSLKHLHRLIVTSNAYQMESAVAADHPSVAIDPENIALWRMNPRRMEAELVRDNLLSLTGDLVTTLGGPELDQEQALSTHRRSLYYRHAPEKQAMFLKLFDTASTTACYRRDVSVVPQQSLALTNSPLALATARRLAGQIATTVQADDYAFAETAFMHVLGRPITGQEATACTAFLAAQTALLSRPERLTRVADGPPCPVPPAADPHQRARENLVLVLINHHDFINIR